MKKTIIFDWHGVLDWSGYYKLLDSLALLSGFSKEEVKQKINGLEHDYVKGAIEPEFFWSTIQSTFDLTNEDLKEAQKASLLFDKNEELWQWLEQNRDKYNYAILSDCPADKLEIIKKEADLSMFNPIYFSVEYNLTKYEIEFFEKMLKVLNKPPEECIFVDDSEKHVESARGLGMQGIVFHNAIDLLELSS